jgi:hypothetical protein
MVRKLRGKPVFAEGRRLDPETGGDEKHSWLDDLKEMFGLQSRPRRPRKKMPMRARFSLGYFIVAWS